MAVSGAAPDRFVDAANVTVVAIVESMPLEKHVFASTAHSIEATVEHVRTGVRIGQFTL